MVVFGFFRNKYVLGNRSLLLLRKYLLLMAELCLVKHISVIKIKTTE